MTATNTARTRSPYKKSIRELAYQIAYRKAVLWGEETHMLAVEAGLLTYVDSEPVVTPEGRRVADEFAAAQQRTRNNANARARNSAMSSLGMKRTRSGSWE